MMADIEKVIQIIAKAKEKSKEYGLDEIRMTIEFADVLVELLKEQPKIVRCKDCIYYHTSCCQCSWANDAEHDDYFCADGERRDDDG